MFWILVCDTDDACFGSYGLLSGSKWVTTWECREIQIHEQALDLVLVLVVSTVQDVYVYRVLAVSTNY